uniref:Uncharacterized protein n=1 Tax=Rhizophora mucronata TaxID=61149 RepID=A0A2P2MEK1_RHIMU
MDQKPKFPNQETNEENSFEELRANRSQFGTDNTSIENHEYSLKTVQLFL